MTTEVMRMGAHGIATQEPLLLTARQAAARLGLSVRSFYELRRSGRIELPPVRLGPQLVRYHADAVARCAAQLAGEAGQR